jgi:hypothetical protein
MFFFKDLLSGLKPNKSVLYFIEGWQKNYFEDIIFLLLLAFDFLWKFNESYLSLPIMLLGYVIIIRETSLCFHGYDFILSFKDFY